MDEEKIERKKGKNDEENKRGDGWENGWIEKMEMEEEEGEIKESEKNIGRIVGKWKRELNRIDKIERIEIGKEGNKRDKEDGWKDERKIDIEEMDKEGNEVELGGLEDLIGNIEKWWIDKNNRNKEEMKEGKEREGEERSIRIEEKWRKRKFEEKKVNNKWRKEKDGWKDEIKDEEKDEEGKKCRKEKWSEIKRGEKKNRKRKNGREKNEDGILKKNMNKEEYEVVFKRIKEVEWKIRVEEKRIKIGKKEEEEMKVKEIIERLKKCIDKRKKNKGGID